MSVEHFDGEDVYVRRDRRPVKTDQGPVSRYEYLCDRNQALDASDPHGEGYQRRLETAMRNSDGAAGRLVALFPTVPRVPGDGANWGNEPAVWSPMWSLGWQYNLLGNIPPSSPLWDLQPVFRPSVDVPVFWANSCLTEALKVDNPALGSPVGFLGAKKSFSWDSPPSRVLAWELWDLPRALREACGVTRSLLSHWRTGVSGWSDDRPEACARWFLTCEEKLLTGESPVVTVGAGLNPYQTVCWLQEREREHTFVAAVLGEFLPPGWRRVDWSTTGAA